MPHIEIMNSKTVLDLFYASICLKKIPDKNKLTKPSNLQTWANLRVCEGSSKKKWPRIQDDFVGEFKRTKMLVGLYSK